MKNKKLLLGAFALVLVGIGAYLLLRDNAAPSVNSKASTSLEALDKESPAPPAAGTNEPPPDPAFVPGRPAKTK